MVACRTVRSGVFHHWIHRLWPQGAAPQVLTLFGGVGFIARRLRRPEKGNADGVPRHFLELPVVLGFDPATGPTLKTALCHIRTLVGGRINIGTSFAENIPGLFWTSVRSVALQKEQWQTWGLFRHLVSTRLPSGGRAVLLSPL